MGSECPRCGCKETRQIRPKPPKKGPVRYVCDGCGASWTEENPPEALSDEEIYAALCAALNKIGKDGIDREVLCEGANYSLRIAIAGNMGNRNFSECLTATVTVGHGGPTSSTSGPPQANVLAYVLTKLNEATRTKILQELPEEYAQNGNQLPEVDADFLKTVSQMLHRLRTKTSGYKSASISVNYVKEDPHGS